MSEISHLIQKHNEGGLSKDDIDLIARRIEESTPGDDADLDNYILLLGFNDAAEYEDTIKKFLFYPSNPWVSARALADLRQWGLTLKYLPQIKEFIRGVEWDFNDQIRLVAMVIAGEFLREEFLDKELLKLLIITFEDLGKSKIIHENNPNAREFVRGCAYQNLARALGKDWSEIPLDDEIEDFFKNNEIDQELLKKAHELIRDE